MASITALAQHTIPQAFVSSRVFAGSGQRGRHLAATAGPDDGVDGPRSHAPSHALENLFRVGSALFLDGHRVGDVLEGDVDSH